MGLLLLAALLGIIPGAIAHGKGHSFVTWWIFGGLLFIVALPSAIVLKPKLPELEARQAQDGMRKCPSCAEMIKADAIVCRYCGRDVPGPAWKPDPHGRHQFRYWDGAQWTSRVSDAGRVTFDPV